MMRPFLIMAGWFAVFGLAVASCESLAGDKDVKRFLCRVGYSHLSLENTNDYSAKPTCGEREFKNKVVDVVVGKESLAKAGVCSDLNTVGFEAMCEGIGGRCQNASTPKQFLCRCQGPGTVRNADGTKSLDGLFRSIQTLDPGTCIDIVEHRGCFIRMEMERTQWVTMRKIATDNNVTKWDPGLKSLIRDIRADAKHNKKRGELPLCMQDSVSVRMGHEDLEVTSDALEEVDGGLFDAGL